MSVNDSLIDSKLSHAMAFAKKSGKPVHITQYRGSNGDQSIDWHDKKNLDFHISKGKIKEKHVIGSYDPKKDNHAEIRKAITAHYSK